MAPRYLISALALCLAGCLAVQIGGRIEPGNVLAQDGEVTLLHGEPIEVFYPVSYVSPPNLTVALPFGEVRVKEQRADGFAVELVKSVGIPDAAKWHAKGQPAQLPPAPRDTPSVVVPPAPPVAPPAPVSISDAPVLGGEKDRRGF
jgi:hypothetical protein